MLTDDARKVIERQKEEYMLNDTNGLDIEMDGMTIVALILKRICLHHKVDMYSEIVAVKKMAISQFDNDVNHFFDAIMSVKLQIDSKDPLAYTDV